MNILTFDIEDWFHTHQNRQQYSGHIWNDLPSKVEANTERILEMLSELDIKATFFVLGWVAEHHPKLIKKIYSEGHEIAAHSHWHHSPRFLTPESFEKDLKLCLLTLEDITGDKITAYRAPGFNLKLKDKWAFEILAENGINVDSSIQLRQYQKAGPFVINIGDKEIIEFPLVTTSFGLPYSGGGYFRALPQSLLNYFFSIHKYNLLYFHPRDFDSDNPYTNLFSLFRNWLNTLNTEKCMDSLKTILLQYETYTISQAAKTYSNNLCSDD